MVLKLKCWTIIVFVCSVCLTKIVCQQCENTVPENYYNHTFKDYCVECVEDARTENNDCGNTDTCKKKELLFMNPQKVLGKCFNTTVTKSLCASHLTVMGSSLVSNHFTRQGIDMCTKVCKMQLEKILKVYPTTVVLKDMYCSRSGIKMASCICEFKVSCQIHIRSVLIHFIVNREGYLAVFDEEVGKPF